MTATVVFGDKLRKVPVAAWSLVRTIHGSNDPFACSNFAEAAAWLGVWSWPVLAAGRCNCHSASFFASKRKQHFVSKHWEPFHRARGQVCFGKGIKDADSESLEISGAKKFLQVDIHYFLLVSSRKAPSLYVTHLFLSAKVEGCKRQMLSRHAVAVDSGWHTSSSMLAYNHRF